MGVGDGATTIGCGLVAIGGHRLTGTVMIIETGTVTELITIEANATKAFTGIMVAANC